MAVAAYTTDLTDIADFDTTGGTAVEPASLWTAGRSPENADGDNPIQGTVHGSLVMNTTGKAGMLVPGSSGWASGDYIFGWIIWLAPGAIATYAAGGLAMILGDSASVFNVYYVGGKDFGLYPIGGWQNFAVDPEMTPDENAGTPTVFDYVGCGANVLSQVSKGSPLMMDAFRYGRGEARVVGGTSTDDDATFSGLAATNDSINNRWGLFQTIEGGFKMKGKLVIGYGAACDFTDANKNIVIDNTEWVASDFNRIELTNASSVISWDNVSFQALGTVSRGQLEMMDNCTFDDTGGVFTGLDTFIYQSNATLVGRTFRGCNQVTQGGASFTDCVFENSTAAVALLANSLIDVDGCIFKSSGTGHAVNLGTIAADVSIPWKNKDSGYAASNGSTGNETILVNVNTGVTLTIQRQAGATTPTIYNTGSGSVSVVSSVSITVNVDNESASPIETALVYVDEDNVAPFIMNTTTNASGVATGSYSGAASSGTLRVRKYGFKPYKGTVSLLSDVNVNITLIADPQQT